MARKRKKRVRTHERRPHKPTSVKYNLETDPLQTGRSERAGTTLAARFRVWLQRSVRDRRSAGWMIVWIIFIILLVALLVETAGYRFFSGYFARLFGSE